MPRRFFQRNSFEAVCFLLQNRRFCPTLKSAVLSHFRNRRFCLIFKIGGFVSFSKSAVLSHLKSAVLSCPLEEYLSYCVHQKQAWLPLLSSSDAFQLNLDWQFSVEHLGAYALKNSLAKIEAWTKSTPKLNITHFHIFLEVFEILWKFTSQRIQFSTALWKFRIIRLESSP